MSEASRDRVRALYRPTSPLPSCLRPGEVRLRLGHSHLLYIMQTLHLWTACCSLFLPLLSSSLGYGLSPFATASLHRAPAALSFLVVGMRPGRLRSICNAVCFHPNCLTDQVEGMCDNRREGLGGARTRDDGRGGKGLAGPSSVGQTRPRSLGTQDLLYHKLSTQRINLSLLTQRWTRSCARIRTPTWRPARSRLLPHPRARLLLIPRTSSCRKEQRR